MTSSLTTPFVVNQPIEKLNASSRIRTIKFIIRTLPDLHSQNTRLILGNLRTPPEMLVGWKFISCSGALTRRTSSSFLIGRGKERQTLSSFSVTMGPNFKRSLARAAAISRMKNASHSDRQNLPTCVSDMAKVSAAIHNQQFPREWESRARYQVLQSLPDPVISEFIFYVTRTPPHTNEEPN